MSELDNYTGSASRYSETSTDTSLTSTTLTTGTTETLSFAATNIDNQEFSIGQEPQAIDFDFGGTSVYPLLSIRENGDIFVRGKKIINDMQVYDALLRWCVHMNPKAVNANELEQILKSRDYKKFYREHHKKHAQPGQTFIDYIRKQQNE